MTNSEWFLHALALYGVGQFLFGSRKAGRRSYPAMRALGRLARKLSDANQGEGHALPQPVLVAHPSQPALPPAPVPESELRGEALMSRLDELKASDREGLKRLMSAAISDGRLELSPEGRPQVPGTKAKAKKIR